MLKTIFDYSSYFDLLYGIFEQEFENGNMNGEIITSDKYNDKDGFIHFNSKGVSVVLEYREENSTYTFKNSQIIKGVNDDEDAYAIDNLIKKIRNKMIEDDNEDYTNPKFMSFIVYQDKENKSLDLRIEHDFDYPINFTMVSTAHEIIDVFQRFVYLINAFTHKFQSEF